MFLFLVVVCFVQCWSVMSTRLSAFSTFFFLFPFFLCVALPFSLFCCFTCSLKRVWGCRSTDEQACVLDKKGKYCCNTQNLIGGACFFFFLFQNAVLAQCMPFWSTALRIELRFFFFNVWPFVCRGETFKRENDSDYSWRLLPTGCWQMVAQRFNVHCRGLAS